MLRTNFKAEIRKFTQNGEWIPYDGKAFKKRIMGGPAKLSHIIVAPGEEGRKVTHAQIIELLSCLAARGIDFIKTENFYTFNGRPGFLLGQGQ